METFSEIIRRWPTLPAFANDMDVTVTCALKWKQRDRIPAPHLDKLVRAANAHGVGITHEDVCRIAAKDA